jgi:MFS family permease
MDLKKVNYSWVMVVVSASILIVIGLQFHCFGVFLKPMIAELEWDRAALSVGYAMMIIVAGPFGIIAGGLSDKYGPRLLVTVGGLATGAGFILTSLIETLWHMYLIWGILIGIGSVLCLLPILALVPKWFIKKRGIATGIVMAGLGVGGIVSPLLTQLLISAYGWRQAFIILGVITIVIITPLAQFMRQSPGRMGLKPYGGDEITEEKQSSSSAIEGLSPSRALRTSRFWLWGVIQAGMFFCMGAVGVHIVPHATDLGIPEIMAASILSISAGVGIFGRLSIGFISDRIGTRLTLSACLSLATLGIIWLLFANEIWMFYLYAVLQGLSFASVVTLLPVLTAEFFGVKSLGLMIGALTLVGIVGEALGPIITGRIFDVTESYRLAFLICVIMIAIALTLSLVLLRNTGRAGMVNEK